jgi:hypothetical protein
MKILHPIAIPPQTSHHFPAEDYMTGHKNEIDPGRAAARRHVVQQIESSVEDFLEHAAMEDAYLLKSVLSDWCGNGGISGYPALAMAFFNNVSTEEIDEKMR